MDRGAGVPHIQEPARNAADLSQTRRDHPRPRLLQLPRPGAEKGTGGPHRRHGRSRAMRVLARDPRRPRLADRDRGRTGRQAFRPALAAPPRRELGAARRRRRPAADRASAPRRLTRSRQLSPNVVPRRFSSADSCLRSKTCRFEVLKISLISLYVGSTCSTLLKEQRPRLLATQARIHDKAEDKGPRGSKIPDLSSLWQ